MFVRYIYLNCTIFSCDIVLKNVRAISIFSPILSMNFSVRIPSQCNVTSAKLYMSFVTEVLGFQTEVITTGLSHALYQE